MRFTASFVATATNGLLHGRDAQIDGVSFDTRSLQPGQLFVPIVADRDGHDFVGAAIDRGASAYLSALGQLDDRVPCIDVADTLVALMDLARARRWSFDGTVIGITGSVGKTSTKDMAWAALAGSGIATWANEASFNNDQGLPTTLLNTPDDTRVMVLEMGMRGFGEIERLCGIAQPHVGVVTRVGEAHSDRVGGIDGVAIAKSELPRALPANGWAILNGDDPRVRAMADVTDAQVLLYGEADDADVRVRDVRLDHLGRPTFEVSSPWGSATVNLGLPGAHMVGNALAALACVGVCGGDLAAAAAALGAVRLSAMRMEVLTTASGATVVNDAYNANPTSMRAAIDALVALPATRRFAVLGVMAEISDEHAEHAAIAAYARARGVVVIALATEMYGPPPANSPATAAAALLAAAGGSVASGDAVLLKGSRVAGVERVLPLLGG